MKRLYVIQEEFYRERPKIAYIRHKDINDAGGEYLIDPERVEIYRIVKKYSRTKTDDHGSYDMVVNLLGNRGHAKNSAGKNIVKINDRIYPIDKLMASTFIKNPLNLPDVIHIDGDKTNDRLENLRWATRSASVKYFFEPNKPKTTKTKIKLNQKTVNTYEPTNALERLLSLSEKKLENMLEAVDVVLSEQN